jgi:hypothetical protein
MTWYLIKLRDNFTVSLLLREVWTAILEGGRENYMNEDSPSWKIESMHMYQEVLHMRKHIQAKVVTFSAINISY